MRYAFHGLNYVIGTLKTVPSLTSALSGAENRVSRGKDDIITAEDTVSRYLEARTRRDGKKRGPPYAYATQQNRSRDATLSDSPVLRPGTLLFSAEIRKLELSGLGSPRASRRRCGDKSTTSGRRFTRIVCLFGGKSARTSGIDVPGKRGKGERLVGCKGREVI